MGSLKAYAILTLVLAILISLSLPPQILGDVDNYVHSSPPPPHKKTSRYYYRSPPPPKKP